MKSGMLGAVLNRALELMRRLHTGTLSLKLVSRLNSIVRITIKNELSPDAASFVLLPLAFTGGFEIGHLFPAVLVTLQSN